MTIENLGVKLYSGTKADRKSDSLGSAADGSNTAITLANVNNYADFNGSSSYVSTSESILDFSASDSFSIAFWFNTTDTGEAGFVSRWNTSNNGWLVLKDSGTTASFRMSSNWSGGDAIRAVATNNAFSDGAWHNCVVTYGGSGHSSIKMYIDGTEQSLNVNLTGTVGSITYNTNLALGVKEGTGSFSDKYDGSMKQVLVYDDVLTQSEVTTLYNSGTVKTDPSTSNLVAWYKLESNANDSQGSNNGTATNITFVSDAYKLGTGAYAFNGSSSVVTTDQRVNGLHDGTGGSITFWVKKNSHADNDIIYATHNASGSGAGIEVKFNSSGNIKSTTTNSSGGWVDTTSTTALANDTWYHVAVTLDTDTKYRIYINGTLETTGSAFTPRTTTSSQAYTIGDNPSSGGWFDGELDDMSIWSRALTATEIETLAGVLSSYSKENAGTPNETRSLSHTGGRYILSQKFDSGNSIIGKTINNAVVKAYKDQGSPTGLIHAYIYADSDDSSPKATSTTTHDPSTLPSGSSNAIELSFDFPNTTISADDSLAIFYDDGSSGNAIALRTINDSNVANETFRQKNSSGWSDISPSTEDLWYKIRNVNGAQLVSSLSDKSNLKAYYSMDTATEGYGNFDGNGDVVTFSSNGIMSGDFTVAMHFYYSSSQVNNYPTFFQNGASGNDRIQITEQNNNKFQVYANSQVIISDDDIVADKWQHLALTGSGADWKLYLDGTVIKTGTGTASRTDTSTKSYGGEPSGSYFTGGQRNFCIYNRALSASEITSLSNETKLPTDSSLNTSSSLKVYCPMWANFNDLSGNSVSMTVNGDASIITGFKCPNNFSSTSDLDSLTGVRTNSIFQQNAENSATPSYWWFNGTSWVLDGTTEKDIGFASGWSNEGDQNGSKQTTSSSSTGVVFTSTQGQSGGALALYDIGSALGSKFVARFAWKTGTYTNTGSGNNGQAGIGFTDKSSFSSSETINTNGSGDAINFLWHIGDNSSDGTQKVRTYSDGTGATGSNSSSDRQWTNNTTYYFELTYDGTTATCTRKTDSTYSTNHSWGSVEKATSGLTGLRYVVFGSQDNGGNQAGFTLTLNELKIQSGVSEWIE